MAIISAFAVYFVIWWLTLFAVLPIGLRTQAEDQSVTPGTVASAPSRFRGGRIFLLTTFVSALIYGAWIAGEAIFGFSMKDLPVIIPAIK